MKSMKYPLGVSPSKGNQGTTRGKEKNSFDLGGNRTFICTLTCNIACLSGGIVSVRIREIKF